MKKLLIAGVINLLLLNIVLAEDKWEYTIYTGDGLLSPAMLERKLNNYGLNGWELISVISYNSNWMYIKKAVYFFKKKIENEDK